MNDARGRQTGWLGSFDATGPSGSTRPQKRPRLQAFHGAVNNSKLGIAKMTTATRTRGAKSTNSVISMTRREVANILGVHQDSVSRLLPEGLAAAVIAWGGHGRPMQFSGDAMRRWDLARRCRRGPRDGPCEGCKLVLEDCQAVGDHLLRSRHGYRGCRECRPPGRLVQPCNQT